MRLVDRNQRLGAPAAPPPRQSSGSAVQEQERGVHLSLAGAGFLLYLWVVHSGKAPIGAAAIVLGLVGLVTQHKPLRLPAPLWWFGGLVAWAGIGYFTAPYPEITGPTVWAYLKLWLIFLLAVNVAQTRGQLRWMMIAWLGIFALYPVRGTLFNMAAGITTQGRYAWNYMFSNPNDLTTLSLPILAMSVSMLQTERVKWVRMCALAGTVLIPIIMFATQSRGGILALFTFSACVLVQYRKRVGVLLLLALVSLLVIQMAPPDVWSRLGGLSKVINQSTIAEADVSGSAEQRRDIWNVARAVIADHPVTGVGVGGYPEVHFRYALTGKYRGVIRGKRDPHSTFLGTTAETGFPGLVLLLAMIGSVFIMGWRAANRLRTRDPRAALGLRTLLFGLVAFLQACLFATMTHVPSLYLYIAVICTMISLYSTPSTPLVRAAPAPARRGA